MDSIVLYPCQAYLIRTRSYAREVQQEGEKLPGVGNQLQYFTAANSGRICRAHRLAVLLEEKATATSADGVPNCSYSGVDLLHENRDDSKTPTHDMTTDEQHTRGGGTQLENFEFWLAPTPFKTTLRRARSVWPLDIGTTESMFIALDAILYIRRRLSSVPTTRLPPICLPGSVSTHREQAPSCLRCRLKLTMCDPGMHVLIRC